MYKYTFRPILLWSHEGTSTKKKNHGELSFFRSDIQR